MTRKFNQRIRCHNCGAYTTEESPFERWMRNHEQLQSSKGIVRFDLDLLLHRYMTLVDGKGTRDIQAMMFVEIKTHMASPSLAQRDTLGILNQILRNRKPNIHSKPKYRQSECSPVIARSIANRRDIRLRMFGGHLLQLDGTEPANSTIMRWDNTWELTESHLVELLRFERDPDCPEKTLDWRRRSKPFSKMPTLFDV